MRPNLRVVRGTPEGAGGSPASDSFFPPTQAAGVMLAVPWVRAVNQRQVHAGAVLTPRAPPAASEFLPLTWPGLGTQHVWYPPMFSPGAHIVPSYPWEIWVAM